MHRPAPHVLRHCIAHVPRRLQPVIATNGSRERAPDDRLREAIHAAAQGTMDCLRLALVELRRTRSSRALPLRKRCAFVAGNDVGTHVHLLAALPDPSLRAPAKQSMPPRGKHGLLRRVRSSQRRRGWRQRRFHERGDVHDSKPVIASEAKQSIGQQGKYGLLRRYRSSQ